MLPHPQLEREDDEHPLVQAAPTDGAEVMPVPGATECVQPLPDHLRGEEAAGARVPREEEVGEDLVKGVGHHHVHGNREPVLGMRGDDGREPPVGEGAQYLLAGGAVGFEAMRQREPEGDDILVQSRVQPASALPPRRTELPSQGGSRMSWTSRLARQNRGYPPNASSPPSPDSAQMMP